MAKKTRGELLREVEEEKSKLPKGIKIKDPRAKKYLEKLTEYFKETSEG